MVKWLERLDYGAESPKGREFRAELCHATTGKLSLSTQQSMGTFFEFGKAKAAKGERWALPFISCAQDTVELYPPLPLWLLGYGKPLPLPKIYFLFGTIGKCILGGPILKCITVRVP